MIDTDGRTSTARAAESATATGAARSTLSTILKTSAARAGPSACATGTTGTPIAAAATNPGSNLEEFQAGRGIDQPDPEGASAPRTAGPTAATAATRTTTTTAATDVIVAADESAVTATAAATAATTTAVEAQSAFVSASTHVEIVDHIAEMSPWQPGFSGVAAQTVLTCASDGPLIGRAAGQTAEVLAAISTAATWITAHAAEVGVASPIATTTTPAAVSR